MGGNWIACATQADCDRAIAAGNSPIVRAGSFEFYGSVTVQAHGSATVQAHDSATVRAYGSVTVWAYGSVTVRAHDSVTVQAHDSATVRAYGSVTVRAFGSATVHASGSATVRAYGSATVSAYDSATVRAYDSATVSAYDSATVRAYGSATVSAYDSATVRASSLVAVHRYGADVTVEGDGHLIIVPVISTIDEWCDRYGVDVADGHVVLFKAVDDDLRSGYGVEYPIGETVTAPDWRPDGRCGGGLHLCATAHHATGYNFGATRWLACRVAVGDLDLIVEGDVRDKVKARTLVVLHEVDLCDRPIASARTPERAATELASADRPSSMPPTAQGEGDA